MPEESANSESSQTKPKRKYVRHNPPNSNPAPIQPNQNILALESDLIPMVRKRQELTNLVLAAQARANQANSELRDLQAALSQVESAVQYQQQIIAQMKGVPFIPQPSFIPPPQSPYGPPMGARFADYPQTPPSPSYSPVVPFPPAPAPFQGAPPPSAGLGSYPAPNYGLHPDATERTESAEDVRKYEEEHGYNTIR